MNPLTHQIVTELDVLYGLYQMAVDLSKRIVAEDEDKTQRVLEARQKILEHTGAAARQVVDLMKAFQAEKIIPSNEKALVDEKRNLILDMGARMKAADHQMLRQMQTKLSEIRKELASQTERKNVLKAYIQAPKSQLMVH